MTLSVRAPTPTPSHASFGFPSPCLPRSLEKADPGCTILNGGDGQGGRSWRFVKMKVLIQVKCLVSHKGPQEEAQLCGAIISSIRASPSCAFEGSVF